MTKQIMHEKKIKVAVCYALLYRFRLPIFQRLAAHPKFSVKYFVGKGIKGAKHVCAEDSAELDLIAMATLGLRVSSGGRNVPLSFNPALLFHLIKHNPDVLLIQGGELPNNIIILTYAKVFRKPIVWWSLGEVQGRTYGKAGKIYRKLVQLVERHCTVFLGYSSVSGKYFLNQGYSPSQIFSLVNVVDTDIVKKQVIEDRKRVESIKNKIGIKDELIILFVGGLTETKGITRLIEAVSNINDIEFHLVIVGEGVERDKAEKLVSIKGIQEKMTFIGAVYDGVGAYFELADLLVMPGTGGLVVSEGMAHGLPVICSVGDGSERDLVRNEKNGFIIPPDDINALTRALRFCLENPPMLKEMGEASLRIIETEHNIEAYMNTMSQSIFCAYDQAACK